LAAAVAEAVVFMLPTMAVPEVEMTVLLEMAVLLVRPQGELDLRELPEPIKATVVKVVVVVAAVERLLVAMAPTVVSRLEAAEAEAQLMPRTLVEVVEMAQLA
jgi:hypothetical protein